MPKVTVYIRKEDYPRWQALDEKTEFIHRALTLEARVLSSKTSPKAKEFSIAETIAFAKNLKELRAKGLEGEIRPCKHGADPTMCKKAKSGKPCKA